MSRQRRHPRYADLVRGGRVRARLEQRADARGAAGHRRNVERSVARLRRKPSKINKGL